MKFQLYLRKKHVVLSLLAVLGAAGFISFENFTSEAAAETGSPDGSSAPYIVQKHIEQTNGGSGVWELNSVVPIASTKAGDTLWVVATIPNDLNGSGTLPGPISVVDCIASKFKNGDCEGSEDTFNQLGSDEVDNPLGEQSIAQFAATNIKAGVRYVVVHWDYDNYKGVLAVEIGNVKSSSVVAHSGSIQNNPPNTDTNGLSYGNMTVPKADTPALLLAVSMDTYGGYSDTGGDDSRGPYYGSSSEFTGITLMWNWSPGEKCNGGTCDQAAFESRLITGNGIYSGDFTAYTTAGQYITVSAIFQ